MLFDGSKMVIEFYENLKLNIKHRIWVKKQENWILMINHGNFVSAQVQISYLLGLQLCDSYFYKLCLIKLYLKINVIEFKFFLHHARVICVD